MAPGEVPAPGPEDLAESRSFLLEVEAAAKRCGVTRIGDITRLDRLGLPVWQAIRPYGRALSVHQGKGRTAIGARIGALCEAIESHAAETAPADGPFCRYEDLPDSVRLRDPDIYGRSRQSRSRDDPVQWCRAVDFVSGREIFLPHPLVSLDLTSNLPSPFDRSSSGLGAAGDEEAAIHVAVRELVERDAQGEWRRSALIDQMEAAIDCDTIPFPWFRAWRRRFQALDIRLSAHALPSLGSMPVIACTIAGAGEFADSIRFFGGSAAHERPETALFKAMAEAIQSRLTWIAGSRDDIYPEAYGHETGVIDLPALTVPGARPIDFAEIAPGPGRLRALADALADEGYDAIIF